MGSRCVASGIQWKQALGYSPRALFYDMQLELFNNIDYPQLTEELFGAYFDCRKNKRNTLNALRFEKHLERNVFKLIDDIYQGKYWLGRSIAFIVNKPVKREIFAADFRDRVVHHWLINKLNPLFENVFIEDSYACRVTLRKNMVIKNVSAYWFNHVYVSGGFSKFILKVRPVKKNQRNIKN